MYGSSARRLLGGVRCELVVSQYGVQAMTTQRFHLELTGQDWFWILFVALVASIATFGGFLLFLPAYVLALAIGYWTSVRWRAVFDRRRRALFVLKVLGVVLPTYALFVAIELWLLPSVYRQ